MLRWICGVTLRYRERTTELINCLGIVRVDEVVCHGRQRWYGLVERNDESDWVSPCNEVQIEGTKSKGKGR